MKGLNNVGMFDNIWTAKRRNCSDFPLASPLENSCSGESSKIYREISAMEQLFKKNHSILRCLSLKSATAFWIK